MHSNGIFDNNELVHYTIATIAVLGGCMMCILIIVGICIAVCIPVAMIVQRYVYDDGLAFIISWCVSVTLLVLCSMLGVGYICV